MSEGLEREIAGILVGESRAIRAVRRDILRFGPTRLPILVQGPTGAGKELVARAMHVASRRPGAFVAFNVCAVSETLLEDALFGHVKGAFTGATRDSSGYLAEANGGSVFLDEVSGLAPGGQIKLLRAIETGVFRPVGAHRDRVSEFRVISASNEDLQSLALEKRFRADLLHRLGGFVVRLPPLAERAEDVPALAAHFLVQAGARGRSISDGAIVALQEHLWPGNVRELRHAVDRALVLAEGRAITVEHVERAFDGRRGGTPDSELDARPQARLLEVLERCAWNAGDAARELDVHRATIYRWIQRLGVAAPARGIWRMAGPLPRPGRHDMPPLARSIDPRNGE